MYTFKADIFLGYQIKNLRISKPYAQSEAQNIVFANVETEDLYDHLKFTGYRDSDIVRMATSIILVNIQRSTYQKCGPECLKPGYVFESAGRVGSEWRITFQMDKKDDTPNE